MPRRAGTLLSCTWVNQGIGSETTTQISSRFQVDVVNESPQWVIINGGIVNIAGGGNQSTFITDWTAMLDLCASNGIKAVVLLMLPYTGGTTDENTTRDTWNTALRNLAAGYSIARVLDMSEAMGTERGGGPAGNRWDLRSLYDADSLHPNAAGCALIGTSAAALIRGG